MVLGGNGEVVELESDDDSAAAQIMATPAAKMMKRTHSTSEGNACNPTSSSSNKALCHDLITSLAQARQGNADIEAKRLDFDKQMAEKKQIMEYQRLELDKLKMELDGEERKQRIEMEKQDSIRKHELQLQSIELQKMQMEVQLAEMKIRMAQLERAAKDGN